MKICFVSGNINCTGGTERVCLLIANELAKKHDVSIVSFKEGLNPKFNCDKRIKLFSLGLENNYNFFERKFMPLKKLKDFFNKNRQDIVINVDLILCLYTIPMKLLFKFKIIAWEHFNFRQNNGVKNRDYARKMCAKFADYIIVLTDADLKEYKSKLKIRNKIERIYNPIVGEVKENKLNKKIVLSSGRFTSQKDFEELIYIWEKIEINNPEWRLIICGDGEDKEKIEKLIEEKSLKNVVLPGFCDNMEEYYESASIFAMTSKYEGFPMVLLEAQQHSVPLIAYDCFTGPSEMIDNNKNGYLIKYGDRKEYIFRLNELMNNPLKLTEFSRNSADSIKKYKIENIMREWNRVISEISKEDDRNIREEK